MAYVQPRRDEEGNITSYRLVVSNGLDWQGRQMRRYSTWTPPKPGMSEKQMEKAALAAAFKFEEAIKAGYEIDKHIRNEDGEVVAEGCTDENGEARFTLRVGKYTYQEFAALEGYELDDAEYPFEIKENGEIVKAVMTNEKSWIPQTGDESNLGIWIALATAAMLGLVATGAVCRKKGGKRAC